MYSPQLIFFRLRKNAISDEPSEIAHFVRICSVTIPLKKTSYFVAGFNYDSLELWMTNPQGQPESFDVDCATIIEQTLFYTAAQRTVPSGHNHRTESESLWSVIARANLARFLALRCTVARGKLIKWLQVHNYPPVLYSLVYAWGIFDMAKHSTWLHCLNIRYTWMDASSTSKRQWIKVEQCQVTTGNWHKFHYSSSCPFQMLRKWRCAWWASLRSFWAQTRADDIWGLKWCSASGKV